MTPAPDGRDPLLAWRAEFPILAATTYLVSHSLGAMPRKARARLGAFADEWAERGVRAWAEGWWRKPLELGDEIARLIGAAPGTVAMHPNVSLCQSLVLSCFEFKSRRNKIVYEGLNFPSVMYVYEAQRAAGAQIVSVPSDDGITVPLERLLAAIDEKTLLVPVSHVLFKSAFIQDLAAITRRAHEVGALVVADVYQSAGTVPVEVAAWDVDFATGGSVKWLCGGPGAGYLYVAPRLHRTLEPRMTGWMAHERPFGFEPGPITYAPDQTRFLQGTPAVPALYAAEAGYEIVNAIGIPEIRKKSIRQVQLLYDLALELDLRPNTPARAEERGGMIVLDVPEGPAVARELLRREIIIDHRPGAGIRVSPHFYTADDELRHALREIRTILDTGAYRTHQTASGTGF
jgi:kynureninase